MDRSFLSAAGVVKASRSFVCVRLATYENKAEAALLKSLVRTRSGELENSVFALLAPDGKTPLARAGRGPHSVASTAARLAAAMNDVAEDNPGKADLAALPLVANLKLAINVAACDNLPLVVLSAPTAETREALEAAAAKLAWRPGVVGKYIWASCDEAELKGVAGAKPGLTVVQPARYGTSGKALAHAPADAGDAKLLAALDAGRKAHAPDVGDSWLHIREGHREGIFWEPPLPVTDPMEKDARQRGKGKKGAEEE